MSPSLSMATISGETSERRRSQNRQAQRNYRNRRSLYRAEQATAQAPIQPDGHLIINDGNRSSSIERYRGRDQTTDPWRSKPSVGGVIQPEQRHSPLLLGHVNLSSSEPQLTGVSTEQPSHSPYGLELSPVNVDLPFTIAHSSPGSLNLHQKSSIIPSAHFEDTILSDEYMQFLHNEQRNYLPNEANMQKSSLQVSLDADYITPLHIAAFRGHVGMIELLLDSSASISESDCLGRSPLVIAVIRSHADATRLLLQRGSSPNTADLQGRTALHWVVMQRHEGILNMLGEAGGDVNQCDINDWSPLHLAVEKGWETGFKIMMTMGGNLGLRARKCETWRKEDPLTNAFDEI